MFKYLENIELENYGLYVKNVGMRVESQLSMNELTIEMEFTMPSYLSGDDSEERLDKFFLDLKMINALQNNCNPAVKKQYEELLVLLALTKDGG